MQRPRVRAGGVDHDERVAGAGRDAVAVAERKGGLVRYGVFGKGGPGREAVNGLGGEGDLDLFGGEAGAEVWRDGGCGLG